MNGAWYTQRHERILGSEEVREELSLDLLQNVKLKEKKEKKKKKRVKWGHLA